MARLVRENYLTDFTLDDLRIVATRRTNAMIAKTIKEMLQLDWVDSQK
jgi:hypothetical protein